MKPVRIVLAVLLTCMLGFGLWELLREHEPSYKGKSIKFWITECYWSRSTRPRVTPDQAREAVLAVGTNALPFYVKLLQTEKDSPLKYGLYQWQARHKWIKFSLVGWRDEELRSIGACGIGVLGPRAKPAFEAITNLLTSGDQFQMAWATRAVVGIGLEGIAPLTNALANTNGQARAWAVTALGYYSAGDSLPWQAPKSQEQVERAAKVVVPVLVPCLRDSYCGVQASAVLSLQYFAREPALVVPALAETGLNATNDMRVRRMALASLLDFHADAKLAVPALVDCLRDSNSAISMVATDVLQQIQREAPDGGLEKPKKP